ncbi:HAMP domain-containing protein [Natronospirillum operosum]|uniref:histidine kinase n=1 Tax=Natronospirillum operosum TaxID=2759953 RepID=A0A4Z0WJ83_9GAMM|nr:ATP-binding protein [Natronospirillum operosum]TGG95867.1 HAMP domain-containing protein [Natronospirillum operosum]
MTHPEPIKVQGSGLLSRTRSSLVVRLLLFMLIGVTAAQLITSAIWAQQVSRDTRHSLSGSIRHLAISMASTVQYFSALPDNVRPVVIDQQREVGGSRYFMRLNEEPVSMGATLEHSLTSLVTTEASTVLRDELGHEQVQVDLVMPDRAEIVTNGPTLAEFPERWVQQSLILEPRPAPVLIVQVRLRDGSWMYMATLLPDPFILENTAVFTGERWLSLLALLLVVGGLAYWFVRRQTRPLAELAAAADAFGRGLDHSPLRESGLRELDTTAHAFAVMESRLQRYMTDRERLFGAISHDLRTPITRLKLRTELLDDPAVQAEFEEDLDDLDLMVNGALQIVKDSDIHEEPRPVDLSRLLRKLARDNAIASYSVSLDIRTRRHYLGKPLALKRCLANLIDNAVQYGQSAAVSLVEAGDHLILRIRDQGPGIDEERIERLFEPYTRLEHGRQLNRNGMGLGLGIARSIVHGHGGELAMRNHPEGGLEITLTLPLSS